MTNPAPAVLNEYQIACFGGYYTDDYGDRKFSNDGSVLEVRDY